MSKPDDLRLRLYDIRQEIAGIRELCDGIDYQAFAGSWAARRAVEHALLIIAEACKHIPDPLKATRSDVPWRKIHGLGNMLRHEYRRIDPAVLWSIVENSIEQLDDAIAVFETAIVERRE